MKGEVYTFRLDLEVDKLIHRLEHELKEIENKNHIESRWQPTSCEFLDVQRSIQASDKQQIKGKLLGVVKERVFHLLIMQVGVYDSIIE